MSVIEKLHRARKLPAHEILRRVRGRIVERWAVARARRHDRRQSSYGRICESGNVALCAHLRAPDPRVYSFRTGAIAENVALVLAHHFDVLGSGWVSADYGAVPRGFAGHRYGPGEAPHTHTSGEWLAGRINAANLADAIRCWRLVSAGYRAIDWQRDLRSGYRWSEGLPSVDLGLDEFPPPGADVKVPWELARMQHLPILAWAFGLARSGAPGFEDAARYQVEFCDQVSDFCALNPPRFGVNWACPMDVAIRVVSWLATFDGTLSFGTHRAAPPLVAQAHFGNFAGSSGVSAALAPSTQADGSLFVVFAPFTWPPSGLPSMSAVEQAPRRIPETPTNAMIFR